ncbi:MAG: cytochrome c biogenesis protein [Actinobacteria bacterium]|nr:cytochrome c biogenesis protein [Actinomycetota bacterium]
MVSFSEYYSFRHIIQDFAPFFKIISLFFAIAYIVFASLKKRKSIRIISFISSLFFFVSFLIILYFHIKIYNNIYLTANFLKTPLRLFPPLWIESEKIFFWTFLMLLFSFPVLISSKNDLEKIKPICFIIAAFLIAVAFIDPFSNPLPILHSEITALESAANSWQSGPSISYIMNFYYRVKYFYHSAYMWIHPPLLFISYALFSLAFPYHLMLIFKKDSPNSLFEEFSYKLVALGYIFLTFGMLVGYPWAIEAWSNEAWWWSPKINVSIMMWLFYTAYLHARIYPQNWTKRTSFVLGALSFVSLIFTYATTYFMPGVHSYG